MDQGVGSLEKGEEAERCDWCYDHVEDDGNIRELFVRVWLVG